MFRIYFKNDLNGERMAFEIGPSLQASKPMRSSPSQLQQIWDTQTSLADPLFEDEDSNDLEWFYYDYHDFTMWN